MKRTLGKWEQHLLFQKDALLMKHIPETVVYSEMNLEDLLNRYRSVYVKHTTTGQGRAIFNVRKSKSENLNVNGFTIQGTPIQKSVTKVEQIEQLLHPFLKFDRKSGLYIIQEDIQSYTQNGQPFSIRVHVQKLKNNWLIGGMYGTTADGLTTESGIVNPRRGANIMTVSEVLAQTTIKNDQKDTVKKLEEIAVAAAKVIDSVLPSRDYGIDFGVNQEGRPILIEVNTTPGIGGFAQIENGVIWRRIVEIRKLQNELDESNH